MQRSGALNPFRDGEVVVDNITAQSVEDFAGFTAEDLNTVDVVTIHIYDSDIRYRSVGIAVSSTTGVAVDMNSDIEIAGKEAVRKFSIIGDGGTATLWVTFWTYGIAPE